MRFNPFNYTKPIAGEKFSGRPEETLQIDYYLKEASTGNPMNIAILGPSQIGKTSFLNYVRHMAEKNGILAIQVSLWEYAGYEPNQIVKFVLRKILLTLHDRSRIGFGLASNQLIVEDQISEEPPSEDDSSEIYLDTDDLLASVETIFSKSPRQKVLIEVIETFEMKNSASWLYH